MNIRVDAARKDVCSFRKLQILISQTADFHFANYRFSFRKLQVFISQTTDSHFANYRFPFPFRFVLFRFANYSKPDVWAFSRKIATQTRCVPLTFPRISLTFMLYDLLVPGPSGNTNIVYYFRSPIIRSGLVVLV